MRNNDLGDQMPHQSNTAIPEKAHNFSRGNSDSPGNMMNARDEVDRGGLLSQAYSHSGYGHMNPNEEQFDFYNR